MERITESYDKRHDLPVQIFNGKEYHLYRGERYYSRGTHRLHRDVWIFYNGEIPKGCHIHHKDENTHNNNIENLEMVESHKHLRYHAQELVQNEARLVKARENIRKASEAAKEWHHSAAGKEWHRLHAIRVYASQKPKKYVCLCCGKEFESKPNGQHKFCSNRCKSKWRRMQGVDNEERVCEYCGKTFIANKYSRKRFCCRSCAGKNSYFEGI